MYSNLLPPVSACFAVGPYVAREAKYCSLNWKDAKDASGTGISNLIGSVVRLITLCLLNRLNSLRYYNNYHRDQ
jgi:hypothetical protein